MDSRPTYQELEQEIQDLERLIAESDFVEKELITSRELSQKIFEHAAFSIVLTDARTGKVAMCNRMAYEELGYTEKEYLNLSHADYIQETPEKILQDTKTILEKGNLTYPSKLRSKTGEVLDFFQRAVTVTINRKTYIHGIRINITEEKKAEKALRESESKYRDILDNMIEGYYEVDLAGRFVFCHNASMALLGYTPEELIGRRFSEDMTPETAEKVFQFYNDVYRKGSTEKRIVYETKRKDGSLVSLETSVSLIRDGQGQIKGFRGITRDVTERIKMVNALQESEEFYRMLFEHAGFAIMLTDARTGYRIAYNKKAYEQLGYTEEEYKNIPSQVFAASDQQFSDLIKNLMEQGVYTNDLKLRNKNGEVRDFHRSAVKLKIAGKTYFHAIRIDVTDQKKTERSLRESESRFRTIFEIAPDPVFLWTADGKKILDANPAACRYSGYSKEELLNMTMADLADPEDDLIEKQWFKELMQAKNCFCETIHKTKGGDKVFVEINSRILDHMGGEIILSFVRDATERKKAEEELAVYRMNLEKLVQERTEKLEAAQRELIKQEKMSVLGQLTATVSHELRKPLGIIHSSQNHLREIIEERDEKTDKHLNRIEEQVRICDSIVSDLLEYTRTSRLKAARGNLSSWMNPLLDRVFEAEAISLKRNLPMDLPETIHDWIKMQQTVINVLDNAIQAVKAKAELCIREKRDFVPRIEVAMETGQELIVMKISDNGVGMDQDTLRQAFEPLFTTRARGTGLGLANVRKILKEHGGEIILSSEPGQGTMATLTIPIIR